MVFFEIQKNFPFQEKRKKSFARRIKTERFFFLYEKKTSLFFPTEKILKRAFLSKRSRFSNLREKFFLQKKARQRGGLKNSPKQAIARLKVGRSSQSPLLKKFLSKKTVWK